MSEQDENDYGGGGCVRTHATNSTSFARCSSQPGNPAYPSMTRSRDNKSQPNGGSGGGLPTLTTASRLDHLARAGNARPTRAPSGTETRCRDLLPPQSFFGRKSGVHARIISKVTNKARHFRITKRTQSIQAFPPFPRFDFFHFFQGDRSMSKLTQDFEKRLRES